MAFGTAYSGNAWATLVSPRFAECEQALRPLFEQILALFAELRASLLLVYVFLIGALNVVGSKWGHRELLQDIAVREPR